MAIDSTSLNMAVTRVESRPTSAAANGRRPVVEAPEPKPAPEQEAAVIELSGNQNADQNQEVNYSEKVEEAPPQPEVSEGSSEEENAEAVEDDVVTYDASGYTAESSASGQNLDMVA